MDGKAKPKNSALSFHPGKGKSVTAKPKPLFKQLIDEIIDGDYTSSPINGFDALRSYEVIEAMKKSAKANKIQYLR